MSLSLHVKSDRCAPFLNVRRKEDGIIDKVRNYFTVTGHNDHSLRAKKVTFLIHVQEGALKYSYTSSLKASIVHLVRPTNESIKHGRKTVE
jgi:hypothetical protein